MVASVLETLGLGEWIADTPEDYHRLAVDRASDPAGLAELRARLRHRMIGSPLCDGVAFTRGLETAYRAMWQRWCGERRG
jgi:predicted O-linked N-acetylglucosamine transferase (SPINDLY family)